MCSYECRSNIIAMNNFNLFINKYILHIQHSYKIT